MSKVLERRGSVATIFAGDRGLRLPGPSPVPDRIVRAMSRPMVSHRDAGFREALQEVIQGLKALFETEGRVYVLAGSGTLAMESAVANLVTPGMRCVVASAGKFGERWIELVQAFGGEPVVVSAEPGRPVTPQSLAEALDAHRDAEVVFATQNESSTAVLHDIEGFARETRSRGRLLVVDAVSSFGGAPLRMDAWGVDVVVTGSQKCLMLPPGLAFVAIGERAWARSGASGGSRYYADWRRYEKALATGETPYTPAVSLIFGLQESLRILAEEGTAARWARHRLMRDMVRAGLAGLGFELLVDEACASPTVTAARGGGVDPDRLRKAVAEETGVVLSGGQGELKGKIFRVGHMGAATPMDMVATLAAVEVGLDLLGIRTQAGSGAARAMEVWRTWLHA